MRKQMSLEYYLQFHKNVCNHQIIIRFLTSVKTATLES